MSGPLDGTAALVTGASSGIGRATARELTARGARVALVARRGDRLRELAAELDGSVAIEADVTDRAAAEGAVEEAASSLGRLDVVVNNAGVMLLGPIEDASVEDWDTMVSVNLSGLLYVAKASLPHLLRAAEADPRRVADLVNVSSVAGRTVRLGSGVYNATKHAVGAFSESMRMEFTERKLRVSLIEPGAVDTELVSHNREAVREAQHQRFEGQGKERLADTDIADAIAYVVTRPRHVAINEVLIRPTDQPN
jgi:NADP-dependent 3-hydroxy acid dehydrogenase YdfG